LPRYVDFSIFQDGGRRHLGFYTKFEIFSGWMAQRAELRRRTKFGRIRPKCGRDMAIFRFFKMAAAVILDYSHLKFLTVGQLKRAELR